MAMSKIRKQRAISWIEAFDAARNTIRRMISAANGSFRLWRTLRRWAMAAEDYEAVELIDRITVGIRDLRDHLVQINNDLRLIGHR